jgi:hypothetical protein
MADFTASLLDFPVRTAAIDTFLRDLKSRRLGDIAALQAVVNDSQLWGTLLQFWREREWVALAPHSPMYVFPGSAFTDDLTLQQFCGEEPAPEGEATDESLEPPFPGE